MSEARLVLTRRMLAPALALGGIGIAAAVVGMLIDPTRVWLNLLVDGFYALTLGGAAIFFFATQRLTSARWSAALRRVPEAAMLTLPIAAALLAALWFGRASIYPWADGAGHELAGGKATYLQPDFVAVRMAAVLAVWIAFALRIRRASLAQDVDPATGFRDRRRGLDGHARLNRLAGAFVPVFALTLTAAAYDWIVSLEPDWFSTMFAVQIFAGAFVQGIAAVALVTVLLRGRGLLGEEVGRDQLHDLGKMLFAFSTFWAYIWVCQYLLIWYGNIPEEVTHYLRRTSDAWLPLFLANLAINWIVPFGALLSARAKRSARRLGGVAALLLVGHWLDLYLLVMPSRWEAPRFGAIELAMAAGCAGLLFAAIARNLSRAPLVPTNDPVVLAGRAHRGGEP